MTFLGASQSAQFALVFWAQQYLPSGLGSVLFATNSFFVLIFAHTITQSERITRVKLLGVGAAFVGVVAIFWPDIFLSQNAATQLYLMAGLALITSAMLSALTSVIVKRYAGGIHPAASVFSQALIGAVVLFSAGWLAEAGLPKAAPASAIAAILYLGIFGSAVAFVGMYWLLTKTTATNVSLMVFFTPIIALILGWAVFNEVPEVNVAIGASLILTGVYVTAKTSSTPH
jgi:drug/metabolite transporter (DMT)-like permease